MDVVQPGTRYERSRRPTREEWWTYETKPPPPPPRLPWTALAISLVLMALAAAVGL